MSIYDYESAFGVEDKTTTAMRNAVQEWFSLYYQQDEDADSDGCQRIPYVIVNKLVKTMFGEYGVSTDSPFVQNLIAELESVRQDAVQLMLVGGECYVKPCVETEGFSFTLIPRNNVLIFARDRWGNPTDMGMVEQSTYGKHYYTLLERRTLDEAGCLTIENRLYRSLNSQSLGGQVSLSQHPAYQFLAETYRYEKPMGSVGVVRMKTPMLNCVDGSADGVSVYAPATGLIKNIDRNEAQLCGEFTRGKSRIVASADLLDKDSGLTDDLFVGLDEDADHVGLTIFSPQLRESSFLARKQEYLRNVESIIGLKRGMLSDTNEEERTATEIASSAGDFNLTIIDFQHVWERTVRELVALCVELAGVYAVPAESEGTLSIDWGNGILYDENKTWEEYRQMVSDGMIRPEIALGWRFNMPAKTEEDLNAIRAKYMPIKQEIGAL